MRDASITFELGVGVDVDASYHLIGDVGVNRMDDSVRLLSAILNPALFFSSCCIARAVEFPTLDEFRSPDGSLAILYKS